MLKTWTVATVCILLSPVAVRAAQAKNLIVGVNFHDEQYHPSHADQDAEIKRLVDSGVKTIRTGLGWNSAYFIIQAYQHGISTDAIVNADSTSKAKLRGPGRGFPLSEVDPKAFANWFKINLDRLEAGGVRLSAIELGNELNTARFNGDIAAPGSGRVLGLADLKNPKDPEAPAIVAGYRRYLEVAAVLKDLRNHSKLNQTTPILSGASGDWGPPGPKSWNHEVGVNMPDSIEFLRENGLDKLVDGYAVHVYPSGDPHLSIAERVASLEKTIFNACGEGTKLCWLTEWGLPNPSQACPPVNENLRRKAVQDERTAFEHFVKKGRLAAIFYYSWGSDVPGPTESYAIFRCGGLTEAGKLALSPM